MKKLLLIFIVIAMAAVSGRFVFLYAGQIPWFRLNSVQIDCRDNLDRQTALKKTRFEVGGSIFRQDLTKACNNLLDMPEIQAVSIHRQLPSTIKVQIETEKVVLIVKTDRLYGLTRALRLKPLDNPDIELPIVTGIDGGSASSGSPSANCYYADKVKFDYALKILDAVKTQSGELASKISEIHFVESDQVEIYFDPNGLKVLLPLRNYHESLSRLVIMDGRGLLKEAGCIDMSGGRMVSKTGI